MKHNYDLRKWISTALLLIAIATLFLPPTTVAAAETTEPESSIDISRGVYLSDLDYIATGTHIGYGTYHKDTNINGTTIQLRLDGALVAFDKGIGAHASSTITYDISAYSDDYTRFCAKLGVDASQGQKGSVWFRILASNSSTAWNDNEGWTELVKTEAVTAGNNAIVVDLDVTGYDYIRLYADANGGNGNDHSVFADARLVKEGFDLEREYYQNLYTVAWYDTELSKHTYTENMANSLRLIQERAFVERMNMNNIQSCVKNDATMADTLDWLLEDEDALRLFLEAGNIKNGTVTLQTLNTLYQAFQDILGDSGDGYVYKKMLIGLAVTFANDPMMTPYTFSAPAGGYDPVERYETVKWLYDSDSLYYTKELFASYNMELMRAVMGDYLSFDETKWVQAYAKSRYPNNPEYWTGPYRFMGYVHPPFYNRDEYFSEETWPAYDEKYNLTEYSIFNSGSENRVFHLWMVYEAGGICWNISRVGQTLNRSFGIPSIGTFQPGHEAYFVYSENEEGQGLWSIGNNVGGWQSAYHSWGGSIVCRYLLDWGSGTPYIGTKNNGSYMLLAQDALNRFDALQESIYLNLLADSYDDDATKLEIYRASLTALNLNLNSYIDIIQLYIAQGETVTEEMWAELALEIISAYTYHPVPMVNLVTAIEPYLGSHALEVNYAKVNALKKAQKATKTDCLQWSAANVLANSMLGNAADDVLATFSFDGENAGCLVLGQSYAEYAFQLKYSLDGGETWIAYTKDAGGSLVIQLTKQQLEAINATDDILLYISGQSVEGENPDYFTIDIQAKGALKEVYILAEDREDRLDIAGPSVLPGLEYSTDNGETWFDYIHEETRFPGEVTVLLRYGGEGLYRPGPISTYQFHESTDEAGFSYISIKELEFVSAGTHQGSYVPENMIDANSFYTWHSKYSVVEPNKTYVIAFDTVKRFAGFRYLPSNGYNGCFDTGLVYTSMDGQTWTEVGSFDWARNLNEKECRLEASVTAKYVKIEALTTYSNGNEAANMYVSGANFSYYEDATREPDFLYSVNYSTYSLTNQDVVATLVVTGQPDQSYTFTENGVHSFTYVDKDGQTQTIEAKVDWIDKTPPTGTVIYEPHTPTNGMVYAYILPDEEGVTVLNGSRLPEEASVIDETQDTPEEDRTDCYHIFSENGTFEFQLQDAAGNLGTVTAEVDWIDTEAPTALIHYALDPDKTALVASVVEPSEAIVFGQDQGSYAFTQNGSYEFVFHDLAGNETRLEAHVTAFDENGALHFSDSSLASGVQVAYSTEVPTNQSVTATLVLPEGYVVMGSRSQYTFQSNGTYTFMYTDDTGALGYIDAVVTWIDREPPTGSVYFDTTAPTNGNVTATLGDLAEEVTILHPADGSNTIVFTDNGDSYFQFSDALGNTTTLPVTVNWIDREPATGEVVYTVIGNTVVAHVTNLSEAVTFGPDSGTYTFTESGSYEFVFYDLAGNETRLVATVDSLVAEAIAPTIEGSGIPAEALVTAPAGGWTEGSNTFTVSCAVPCYVAVSEDGVTYTRLEATQTQDGYAFTAEHITAQTRIAVVVAGDTNGSGSFDSNDLLKLRAATLNKTTLDALGFLAADQNGDGQVDVLDLLRLKAVTLQKSELAW